MASSVIKQNAVPIWSEVRDKTTDSHGRITTSIDMSHCYIVKAWVRAHSYLVLPYIFRTDTVNTLNFLILNSETFNPVSNTTLTVEFYRIDY